LIEIEDWNKIAFKNQMPPEKGRLLIANPFMPDPNFRRSVVLLTEHNEEGTMGFILNKPVDITLREVTQDVLPSDTGLYFGGPVQLDTLHFIHRYGSELEGAVPVCDGVYWGGDVEQLKTLVYNTQCMEEDFRFLIGYSGWSAKQLVEELEEGSWIVCLAHQELIFGISANEMWRHVLRSLGNEYAVIANFPEDPRLN
jgi:putative transcriptional regulator